MLLKNCIIILDLFQLYPKKTIFMDIQKCIPCKLNKFNNNKYYLIISNNN